MSVCPVSPGLTPFAFTDYRSAGAVLSLSPRGDMHADIRAVFGISRGRRIRFSGRAVTVFGPAVRWVLIFHDRPKPRLRDRRRPRLLRGPPRWLARQLRRRWCGRRPGTRPACRAPRGRPAPRGANCGQRRPAGAGRGHPRRVGRTGSGPVRRAGFVPGPPHVRTDGHTRRRHPIGGQTYRVRHRPWQDPSGVCPATPSWPPSFPPCHAGDQIRGARPGACEHTGGASTDDPAAGPVVISGIARGRPGLPRRRRGPAETRPPIRTPPGGTCRTPA